MEKVDLLIVNAAELVTLAGRGRARVGDEMQELGIIENGAMAVADGKVVECGTTEEVTTTYEATEVIDASSNIVLPGFVDAHTHSVFAGSRENEMEMRAQGATYLDILKAGGGIHVTVRAVQDISEQDLFQISKARLDRMLAHGTTTVEIKTGYGLDAENEEKLLRVIDRLKTESNLDVVSTFLGAHTMPKDTDRKTYLDWLAGAALTRFKNLAEFVDVFCEEGAFSLSESEQILEAAKQAGYKLKIHAGQFNDLGAAGMAARLGIVSIDHCDEISSEQLDLMSTHGSIAVLLPGVSFYLDGDYPDITRFHQARVPIALATDFNPGSCPSYSMQMMIALACTQMKMSAAEAISASTINAAYAVDRGDRLGSFEPGKQADALVLDIGSSVQLPYFFGGNLANLVIKKGVIFPN